jgi:hypothetical protein
MDSRVELSLINKHVRQHHREAGESVVLFEFIPFASAASAGSLLDDIYDMGAPGPGGRTFKEGIRVPTIYVEEQEDAFTRQDDGRQPTQNLHITMLYKDLVAAGVTAPEEYRPHLNDVFMYDNRYYFVSNWRVRGRLDRSSADGVVVAVSCYEGFLEDELAYEPSPSTRVVPDLYPSTFPLVSV